MMHNKISVIVPCYNEENIIYNTYKQIKEEADKINDNYEIIFANDGSTDNTKKILKSIVAKNKITKLISWQKNRGMGYTHRKLYRAAKGNVVIEMDADLSIKPIIFNEFLKHIKHCDIVIASRYVGIKGKIPLYRKFPSKIYYLLCRILFGIKVKDILSGFIAFRKTALENIKLKSNGFEVHIELMYKLKQKGYKIKEIPAYYSHRSKGSKFSMLINGPSTFYKTLLFWVRKNKY
jgi:glycosyltransferase involved in cell wall biosynthesis